MTGFCESSVVAAELLHQPLPRVDFSSFAEVICSEILFVEIARTLHNLNLRKAISNANLDANLILLRDLRTRMRSIPMLPEVLGRVGGPLPTSLKTLDAIHLASAQHYREFSG